jgi:hypothetical protein
MLAEESGPFLRPGRVALMASRGGSRPALIFRAFVDGAHTPASGHESEPFRPRRLAPVADATAHEKSPGGDASHGRAVIASFDLPAMSGSTSSVMSGPTGGVKRIPEIFKGTTEREPARAYIMYGRTT